MSITWNPRARNLEGINYGFRCVARDLAGPEMGARVLREDQPSAGKDLSRRLKGGSWYCGVCPDYFRCAYRFDYPDYRSVDFGFRGAITLPGTTNE